MTSFVAHRYILYKHEYLPHDLTFNKNASEIQKKQRRNYVSLRMWLIKLFFEWRHILAVDINILIWKGKQACSVRQ